MLNLHTGARASRHLAEFLRRESEIALVLASDCDAIAESDAMSYAESYDSDPHVRREVLSLASE